MKVIAEEFWANPCWGPFGFHRNFARTTQANRKYKRILPVTLLLLLLLVPCVSSLDLIFRGACSFRMK